MSGKSVDGCWCHDSMKEKRNFVDVIITYRWNLIQYDNVPIELHEIKAEKESFKNWTNKQNVVQLKGLIQQSRFGSTTTSTVEFIN